MTSPRPGVPAGDLPEPPAMARLVERFLRRAAAIESDGLRSRAVAADLEALSPATAAAVLSQLVRAARDRRQAAMAVAAIVRALMRGELEDEHVAAIAGCARSRADRPVEALLASGPAAREYDCNDELFIDRRMRSLTLGERRALSRSKDIDQLIRLAHDQDPRVIAELLRNPRLTEREAVLIAARRPTHAHVLEAVLSSRFGSARRVRRAIAHNPYASVAQAARAMATLTTAELQLIASDDRLSPVVRRHARSLRVNRRATPAERERAPAIAVNDLDVLVASLEPDEDEAILEVVPVGADGRPLDT